MARLGSVENGCKYVENVVGPTVLNPARSDKRILSEAFEYFVRVYLEACKGTDIELDAVTAQCEEILNTQENSNEAIEFVQKLKDVSMKMCNAVRQKLRPFLNGLIDVNWSKEKRTCFLHCCLIQDIYN